MYEVRQGRIIPGFLPTVKLYKTKAGLIMDKGKPEI